MKHNFNNSNSAVGKNSAWRKIACSRYKSLGWNFKHMDYEDGPEAAEMQLQGIDVIIVDSNGQRIIAEEKFRNPKNGNDYNDLLFELGNNHKIAKGNLDGWSMRNLNCTHILHHNKQLMLVDYRLFVVWRDSNLSNLLQRHRFYANNGSYSTVNVAVDWNEMKVDGQLIWKRLI